MKPAFPLASAPKALLALLLLPLAAAGAEAPLELSAKFSLSREAGKSTFFELMSGDDGIKAKLDEDYGSPVEIVDSAAFRDGAANFAHVGELARKVKGGMRGLEKAVSELAGKRIPESKMYGSLMGVMRDNDLFAVDDGRQQSRLVGALVPVIALASGKGVLVQLDKETYVYNYGYAPGSGGSDLESDKNDRKTGRSYGASAGRNAYDPSDNDYLRELAEYTAGADAKELKKFYTTLFSILLKSDASGIKRLSDDGQTVIADFMAIYMAELDRHLMTGLKMYEWENALTEITMLAAYSSSENGVTLDPRGGASNENERGLVASSELKARDRLLGFFGVGTDGSGLDGRNKQRRHAITRKVVSEQRALDEQVVSRVEKLIGARAGADIYNDVMELINDFGTQAKVKRDADELIEALTDFVLATRSSAGEIKVL